MVIRVEHGKGGKDRYVMLSPQLLRILRAYWRLTKPAAWLFPGRQGDRPVGTATLQAACRVAAREVGLAPTALATMAFDRITGMSSTASVSRCRSVNPMQSISAPPMIRPRASRPDRPARELLSRPPAHDATGRDARRRQSALNFDPAKTQVRR